MQVSDLMDRLRDRLAAVERRKEELERERIGTAWQQLRRLAFATIAGEHVDDDELLRLGGALSLSIDRLGDALSAVGQLVQAEARMLELGFHSGSSIAFFGATNDRTSLLRLWPQLLGDLPAELPKLSVDSVVVGKLTQLQRRWRSLSAAAGTVQAAELCFASLCWRAADGDGVDDAELIAAPRSCDGPTIAALVAEAHAVERIEAGDLNDVSSWRAGYCPLSGTVLLAELDQQSESKRAAIALARRERAATVCAG